MSTWFPHRVALALASALLVASAPALATPRAAGHAAERAASDAHAKKNKKGKKDKGPDGRGPFKKKDYPVSERVRPLVLPNKMGEVDFGLGFARYPSGVPEVDPVTTVGLNANVSYGLQDKFEIGAGTGILLSPDFQWSKSLSLQGHYLAYDTKELDWAPGIVVPLGLYEGAPFTIVGDLPARYVLSDGLFLRFGQGALPIMLSPDFGLAIVGNGGIGFQVNNQTLLALDTNVVNIALAPESSFSGIWDVLNVTLTGQYTFTRKWDAGANLNITNVWGVENSSSLNFGAYGRYRF